ncbi:MAG TPA: hypothetical protein VF230_15880 [Acidimicrobiales bacterium]
MRRTTRLLAKTPVACGAPAQEAWPESRPSGPSDDDVEYVELTGNYAAVEAYRADIVQYLEAKACGGSARSRMWKYAVGAVVGWVSGAAAVKSAFKRKPKPAAAPKPIAATPTTPPPPPDPVGVDPGARVH